MMAIYTFGVWMAIYLLGTNTEVPEGLHWCQLLCLGISTFLIVELNNSNALLRIRSRMVSATFLGLTSTTCFLVGSISEDIVQLCFIGMLIILFQTYQNPTMFKWHFYSFLCIGTGSLFCVHILWFVPLLWILTATQLQSLNFRTWIASLIGLATPYWFAMPWVIYQKDLHTATRHFAPLGQLNLYLNSSSFTIRQTGIFILTIILLLFSIGHFWLKSYEDKIRIRMLLGFFIAICLFCLLLIGVQPQQYSLFIRILILCASPLIAHFFTFTNSRETNVIFIITVALAFVLTVFNIFNLQMEQFASFFTKIWNGSLIF